MTNKRDSMSIKKAYSDYTYTRNMMECDGEPGISDLETVSLRYLKQHGKLDKLEDIDGHGSYAAKINVNVSGDNEPWLLMTDNNESLEGALKTSIQKRNIPYATMRVSIGGIPSEKALDLDTEDMISPAEAAFKSAEEFSAYAAAAEIPTGTVAEMYHPAFAGSRVEVTGVVSAVPAVNMRRDGIDSGDSVFLAEDEGEGTRHDAAYLRKIKRLLSSGEAARMVKAISPADGGSFTFRIGSENVDFFKEAADANGLKCTEYMQTDYEPEAGSTENAPAEDVQITEEQEQEQGSLRRESGFSDYGDSYIREYSSEMSFAEGMKKIAEGLNICSAEGLTERFDSTVGSGTVLMPLGGINQLTPAQAMVNKIPVLSGFTDDCSVSAWGGNPYIAEKSMYRAGYIAVIESISKLVATGASFNEVYLSLYGSFGSEKDAEEALLGAFEAEMGLGVPAVSTNINIKGGADPSAFISFSTTMGKASEVVSPEFKGAGHRVVMLSPENDEDEMSAYYGMPSPASLIAVWRKAYELIANGRAVAAYTPGIGSIAEAIMKMAFGNGIGFEYVSGDVDWSDDSGKAFLTNKEIFDYSYGSIILEMATDDVIKSRSVNIREVGRTTGRQIIGSGAEIIDIGELLVLYEGKLEGVFPSHSDSAILVTDNLTYSARSWPAPIFKRAQPKVLIPLTENTFGEDAARAVREAGGKPEVIFYRSLGDSETEECAERFAEAVKNSQIIFLPDGYSQSITASSDIVADLFRNEAVSEVIAEFLDRKDGLIGGVGKGFKSLISLGLIPFGRITDEEGISPETEPFGAGKSRIVHIRVASNKSPWLRSSRPGEIYSLPVFASDGRLSAPDNLIKRLAVNGQIATQYVDLEGQVSSDIRFNPFASALAAEAITSPDGRILGRMGHAERVAQGLYANVPGKYLSDMFENAVRYFK